MSSLLVLTSRELLKGRCAFFCPVLCPEVTETLEPYMGHFAVSLLANRKNRKEKSHMEQSREIKHGTSSLVI